MQQRKFKNFYTSKYKLNATTQPLTQKEDGIPEKRRNPFYSDILKRKKSNTNLKRKTRESNTLANKPTTVEQLRTLTRENHHQDQLHHESKSRRITETANKTSARPKRQLQHKRNNNSSFKEPKQQPTDSKNAEMASNNNGGQQQNMEIINMISYIEQTMKTLKSFGEQLKLQLDTNLIQ